METEAKLVVPNRQVYRDLLRVRELAGCVLAPAGRARVRDLYFDTAGSRLLAAGYACRLRTEGDAVIATLKGLGGFSGAIHRRAEEEVRLDVWSPDVAGWPEGPARTLALELTGGEPLRPLFELEQLRVRSNVMDGERRVAEFSLDAVRALVGRRPALYYELEVELAPDGTEADLARLQDALVAGWQLAPEARSKFERGLEALRRRGAALEGGLTDEERAAVERYARGGDPEVARRAGVVLAWAEGLPTREIVARTGLSSGRVRFWVRAYRADRLGIFAQPETAPERPPERPARRPRRSAAASAPPVAAPIPAPAAAPAASPAAKRDRRRRVLPSAAEFAREHGVDMAHARFVAAAAVTLFNALRPMHRLPRRRRRLLRQAALLLTVGARRDPEHLLAASRDLILAQPLHGVSTADRLALACIVSFQRDKTRPEREPTMAALAPKERGHVIALAALLRVAEALDFSRTQSTEIRGIGDPTAGRCEIDVSGAAAELDALQAAEGSRRWRAIYGQELAFLAAGPQLPAASPEPILDLESAPAEVPPLLAADPMSEAGRKTLWLHFRRMLANEAGTRAGEDIEALHDMRVATRRMRAAHGIFAEHFDPKVMQPHLKGLRRTGRVLGAVRDLDVLLAKAEAYQAGLPPEGPATIVPLLDQWRSLREAARCEMLEHLDSPAYRRFVVEFHAFLTTPGAGAVVAPPGEPSPYQVRHVAPRLIFTRYETVRAYETILEDAPLTTYHRLRIDCKRLRYALEFFRDVLGSEAGGLIKQVTGLQDVLGELQDAHVAEGLIGEFMAVQQARRKRKDREAALPGIEGYLAEQLAIQQRLLGQFAAPWTAVTGESFRQSLGLAVAAL